MTTQKHLQLHHTRFISHGVTKFCIPNQVLSLLIDPLHLIRDRNNMAMTNIRPISKVREEIVIDGKKVVKVCLYFDGVYQN